MVLRGQVLIASTGGSISGKPRPVVVVQDPRFDFADTLIVVPLTTEDAVDRLIRPLIQPDEQNGLDQPSSAMINRIGAIRKSDVGRFAGSLSRPDMERVDAALSLVLGLNTG
jgi:mRNA interferase MazF